MSSPHSDLINKLFKNDEVGRQLAHGFVAKFGDVPGMADRIPALLNEAARSAEQVGGGQMSPGDARAYLADFASTGLGMAPHHMADLTVWFEGTAAEAPDAEQPPPAAKEPLPEPAPALPAKLAQPTAAALFRPVPDAPDRAVLQAQIAAHEKDMRSEPGSDGWTRYWRGGGSQAYLAALQAMDTAVPEASAAPGTLAAGGAPAQFGAAAEPAAN